MSSSSRANSDVGCRLRMKSAPHSARHDATTARPWWRRALALDPASGSETPPAGFAADGDKHLVTTMPYAKHAHLRLSAGIAYNAFAMLPRHLERIVWTPHHARPPAVDAWPYTIPAVAQIVREGGLDVPAGVTFLVGENGSGKSTLIEAIAERYPRGGHETPFAAVTGPARSQEDSPLAWHLRLQLHRFASPAGFFLRAEAMHDFFTTVDNHPQEARAWGGEKLQQKSHGESFLAVFRHRFDEPGVYFLDEPEAALSFQSCLALLSLLDTLRREGSQVLIATHSPLLVSLPGANLLELDNAGIHKIASFEDLSLVRHWRSFLREPARYLRHLFA
jgi:predicted ATPase